MKTTKHIIHGWVASNSNLKKLFRWDGLGVLRSGYHETFRQRGRDSAWAEESRPPQQVRITIEVL